MNSNRLWVYVSMLIPLISLAIPGSSIILSLVLLILLMSPLIIMAIVSCLAYKCWQVHRQQVLTYLTTCHHLLVYVKKSVRLIQEMELIARGFTMVSAMSPVARLEQQAQKSIDRQCPQLRRTVFLVARDVMLSHMKGTTQLLGYCQLLPEVDNAANYIASISLEDFGPCLSLPQDGTELQEATDNFSLSALKAMQRICELQCSEFARRLALSHASDLQSKKFSFYQLLPSLGSVLRGVVSQTEISGGSLVQSYNFHRCVDNYTVNDPNKQQSTRNTNNTSHNNQSIYVAIHSLELHLLSLLKRVRNVEENLSDEDEKASFLPEQFTLMKAELDACGLCWEEGLSRLNPTEPEKEPPKMDPSDLEPPKPVLPPIPIFDMGEPIIEDEVFEAYIDSSQQQINDPGWDDELSPEEKAKKKKEKREAVRVLKELKNVISVRATEREIREQKALMAAKKRAGLEIDDVEIMELKNCELAAQLEKEAAEARSGESLNTNSETGYPSDLDCESDDENKRDRSKYRYIPPGGHDEEEGEEEEHFFWGTKYRESNWSADGGNDHQVEPPDGQPGRTLQERLGAAPGFSFTANIAALAAAKSRDQTLAQETFGDDSDDGEFRDSS